MNNTGNVLIKLMDIIRKDNGINNSAEAMKHISLLLLLKYIYDVDLTNGHNLKQVTFSSYFSRLHNDYNGRDDLNFYSFHDIFYKSVDRKVGYNDFKISDHIKKTQLFLNHIPFKIQSSKVLESVLMGLDGVKVNTQLANDYDDLIISTMQSSISIGEFYAPKALVIALVKVSEPEVAKSIYNPAMGSGNFLVESKKLVNKDDIIFKGGELSLYAYLIATLNLLLNNIDMRGIDLENSLLSETENKYDLIFSIPPRGPVSKSGAYEYVEHGLSVVSQDAMFVQHAMARLAKGGKAVIAVPDGFLFNKNKELAEIRRNLLKRFNLHSILSLPSGILSPYAGVNMNVLFFDNTESVSDIWFYQLTTEKPLNKTNRIIAEDFSEFIGLFPKRVKTSNSLLINKQDILDNEEGYLLNFKIASHEGEKNKLSVSSELNVLLDEKKRFDHMFSKFFDTLTKREGTTYNTNTVKVLLGELINTRAGKPLNKSEIEKVRSGDAYPVYGANGAIGHFKESNREGDCIVVGRVGAHCGNVHYVKEPIWLTSNAFSIEINNPDKVYAPYFVHVLRSLNLNKLARGSAQPSISFSSIKDIEVVLPSYDQQVECSEWFDKIESQKLELNALINLQAEKIEMLSNYSIISHCIDKKVKDV